jgi:hypothetical protein
MANRLIDGILHHSRDQLCSLAFLLGNIYFIACSYAGGFGTHSFQKCSKPAHWGVPFLFGTIPFFARFGQSIRRWWDSGSITHLINVRLLSPFMDPTSLVFVTFIFRPENISRGLRFTFATSCGDIMVSISPSDRSCC